MKRILAITLVLVLLLSGCNHSTDDPSISTTTLATTQPTATEESTESPTYSQLPMFAVSVPANTQETITQDGSLIFYETSQSMQLVMQDPDVVDSIIIDFLNRVDQVQSSAESIQTQSESSYSVSDSWTPYFSDLTYNPTRIDQSVLSLYGSYVTYNGGIHPEYTCMAANYDMVTGDVLTLGSILYHADALEPLRDLVIEKLDAMAQEKKLFHDFDETVKSRFSREESYDEDWYFSQNGLCFYFAPYEIAPYTSGTIIAEIPYPELIGIIGDGFFPPEYDTSNGNVTIIPFENADLEQFTQIAEVSLANSGDMFLLYTDSSLSNIQLRLGSWDETESVFTYDYTVFAASTLTPGDAIVVTIPSDQPMNLQLSYKNANGTKILYFNQSEISGPFDLCEPVSE